MAIDENEFFRQATLRISSSLNVETAMQNCMDYLKQHMPVSGMFFGVYDANLNVGRMIADIWPKNMTRPGKTISIPTKFWDVFKENWGNGPQIDIINDINEAEEHIREIAALIWSPADVSHLKMDLEIEEAKLGSLGIFAEGRHRYTEEHGHLISLLHDPFAIAISNILRHQEILRLKDLLADENRYLHREMMQMAGDTIIGANFGLKDVMHLVDQVAPLNSPVLLMGETGTGKEVIANAIHQSSQRRGRSFIKVNCGAIPDNLVDSELFGHEKGAFTGAIAKKRGRFERAHKGTIFLDEVGELPPHVQVRLLRVLQQREIERVGGTATIPVDVRIISATHQNLEEMVRSGQFREDLWFRLNVFPIIIPPLRQRTVDIPALVTHFLNRKSKELKIRDLPSLAIGTVEKIQTYEWPGNVRELENLVERTLILNQMRDSSGPLTLDLFPKSSIINQAGSKAEDWGEIQRLEEVIAHHIKKALDRAGGRVEGSGGAAQILGLHPSTLRGRMRKLKIPHGRNTR